MKINFIPDKVLKLNNETDLLGTKPYSKTIFEIINNCDGKKNIGLFGSWGSGKSTILKTFEDLIDIHNSKKNKNDKIAYFEFDAWKYSRDDFRRSFLIELTSKFNIKYKSKLQKLLYSESSFEDPVQNNFRFNWLSFPDWIIFFLVVFAFLFYFLPILNLNKNLKATVSLIVLTISLLSKATTNTINKYKVVVKENKIVEPERFETIFDEIISEVTTKTTISNFIYRWIEKLQKKPKYSKVVIVIDNLDRCDDENLLVTLNTIKNFLEHEKVIFILPVDEKGISSFLSQKTDNPDEYLRKIFHLIIRLKSFSKKELFEFTNRINESYKLSLNSSSMRIICQEFTNNPRKIIQFLNNYQSEMRLVDEQSKMGFIDGDYIQKNLSFFIKLLIIKYEWKTLYDEIIYDKNLLNKINSVITNVEPDNNNQYLINRTNVNLNDAQRNFFFSTQEIHCSKIDPFVLNIDLDKDIPDEIESFIRAANYNEISNYLKNDEIDFNEYKLIQKINEVFSNLTFKHREYSFIALPILKLLIEFVLDDKQQKFKSTLIKNKKEYTFLKSLFKDQKLKDIFDKFDFERLTKASKWFTDNISDDLFNSFVSHLKSTLFNPKNTLEKENKKISFFINTFKDTGKLETIKKEFSSKLDTHPELTRIDLFKDYDIASKVITPSTYKLMAKKLNDDKLEGKYRISIMCSDYLINNQKDNITREHLINYNINQLEDLYKTETISENVYSDYRDYFGQLNKLLTINVNVEFSESLKGVLVDLNTYFHQLYVKDFDENKLFDLYKGFFELIRNFIFYTKIFNSTSDRTKYFGNYLKKDFSTKISLIINEILHQDVVRHEVYDYPFSETLIELYKNHKKPNFPYAKTLFEMLEKSNEDEGLSKSEIEEIILRTINVFSIYSNKVAVSLMKRLKKSVGNQFLKELNADTGVYTDYYVKNVKTLKDKWFYGDSILNYLKYPLINSKGTYPNFRGRLVIISQTFSVEEQSNFIQALIDNSDTRVYKWLRLSFTIIPKKVFDVYLMNLIFAHENNVVGHNDFFEWIVKIPKKHFYKNRLAQFVNYLNELEVNHKTYKPKKDNAKIYLESS